jgi:hypothetical protein
MAEVEAPLQGTLREILERVHVIPRAYTIYATREAGEWQLDPTAVASPAPADRTRRLSREGGEPLDYLLEVEDAVHVHEDWCSCAGKDVLTAEEFLRIVAYYAENDAYPTG